MFPLAAPPQVDSIELVCLEHLDVGFTASPQEIARREKVHLDHAIALCRERPDFRWTVESVWQLEQWLVRTPEPAPRAQLVALVKEGRIEIAGGFANFHSGVMDAELLLRAFEPAERIRRELGVAITTCVQDDVPGFSALLPTAMAGSGIRHFLAGVNTSFGGGTSIGASRNPFWWEGLDGSRVLTWVAHGSYVEAERVGLGVWSKEGEAEATLPPALEQLHASGYPFSRVLAMAATGDNGDPDAARSILRKVDAWNAAHATPKVRFTTPGAFFAAIEKEAAARTPPIEFPTYRGDWSGHWEPVKATAPAALALYRDAMALLPGAEALSLRAQRELGLPLPQHDLDEASRALLLYSEHSRPGGVGWPKLTTADAVRADAQFTYRLAFGAHETLRALVERVTDAYAERLGAEGGMRVIANPLPFARSRRTEYGAPFGGELAAWAFMAESTRGGPSDAVPPGLGGGGCDPAPFVLAPFDRGSLPIALDPERHRVRCERDEAGLLVEPLTTQSAPAEFDPTRLLARFTASAPSSPRSLRFTTAAGVIGIDDFLPGALPRSFCTTGAIELAPAPADGRAPAGPPLILLTREAASFQWGAPGWIGATEPAGSGELWLLLLDRPVKGETKDDGPVAFDRIEPTLAATLRFHVCADERFDASGSRAARDAALVRTAWEWRCPTFTRTFAPWFPSPKQEVGTNALVTVAADHVLVLACHAARLDASGDVILRLQEIGGSAATGVAVSVALAGCDVARPCDLLERPLDPAAAPRAPTPLIVDLRPHEVATFRLSRS